MIKRLLLSFLNPLKPVAAEPRPLSDAERKLMLSAARTAVLTGDLTAAIAPLNALLGADSDDTEALALEGMRLYGVGNHQMAVACLQRTVALGVLRADVFKFLASSLLTLGDSVAALPVAESAYRLAPADPEVANLLGAAYMDAERYAEAADYFGKALAQQPANPAPLLNLVALDAKARFSSRRIYVQGAADRIRQKTIKTLLPRIKAGQGSEADSRIFMRLASDDAAYFDVALKEADRLYREPFVEAETASVVGETLAIAGDLPRAIEMYEHAADGLPGQSGVRVVLAQLYIAQGAGKWLQGWQLYGESLWQSAGSKRMGGLPLWNGERLGKRKLFVYRDQGFGDMLLSLRVVQIAASRGLSIVFWAEPTLAALIGPCLKGVELVATEVRPNPVEYGCVALTPVLRLIHLLKLRPADIRNASLIQPIEGRCTEWKKRLQNESRFKIGAVFSGNPWRIDDWFRTVPPSALEPLTRLKDVVWVNLAVDARLDRDLAIKLLNMLDPTPVCADFADTAALIAELDVVVAIDCSVAHLAAALGKKVLVLVPPALIWRWRVGDDPHPWWPAARIFRGKTPARWDEQISQVADVLAGLAAARPPQL